MAASKKPRKPSADESFELYDLKVEVTAPKGGKIYCGAKPGDYFELMVFQNSGTALWLAGTPGYADIFLEAHFL